MLGPSLNILFRCDIKDSSSNQNFVFLLFQMSGPNNAFGSTSNNNSSNPLSLLNICGRVTFDGYNFNDWIRNIRMALRYEEKEPILDKELAKIDEATTTPEEMEDYRA